MERTALIAIGGGSGSGKSTLASALGEALVDCGILPLDAYYRDLSEFLPAERGSRNFDHPDALELELLTEHLSALGLGENVLRPVYDYCTHTRTAGAVPIQSGGVLILEGIYALYHAPIRRLTDWSVFVETPGEVRLERRLARDVLERGRTPESVRRQFETTVEPMYERYVLPTRQHADWIADGTASPVRLLAEALQRLPPRLAGRLKPSRLL